MSLKLELVPGTRLNAEGMDLSGAQAGDALVHLQSIKLVPLKELLKLARDPSVQSAIVGEVVEVPDENKQEDEPPKAA